MPSLTELAQSAIEARQTTIDQANAKQQRDADALRRTARGALLGMVEEFLGVTLMGDAIVERTRIGSDHKTIVAHSVEIEGFWFYLEEDNGYSRSWEPFGPEKVRHLGVGVMCPNGHFLRLLSGIRSENFQKPTAEQIGNTLASAATKREQLKTDCDECLKEGKLRTSRERLNLVLTGVHRSVLRAMVDLLTKGYTDGQLDKLALIAQRLVDTTDTR